MNVAGPGGAGAGLWARDRAVGVEVRSSSRCFDVYSDDVGVDVDPSACSCVGMSLNAVGRSGVDLLGVLAELDERADMPTPDIRAGLRAPSTLDRRGASAGTSSSSFSSSTVSPLPTPRVTGLAVLAVVGVARAPLARGRKTTPPASGSCSSSEPPRDSICRGVEDRDAPDAVVGAEGPAACDASSTSSYADETRVATPLGLRRFTKLAEPLLGSPPSISACVTPPGRCVVGVVGKSIVVVHMQAVQVELHFLHRRTGISTFRIPKSQPGPSGG